MGGDIRSLDELAQLVRDGVRDFKPYGEVNALVKGDLILFNYTQMAQFANRWNWFERVSRGLILSTVTGQVVARPFSKFMSYGQEMPYPGTTIVDATEKMDGSLAIIFNHQDHWRVATRGSFTSDQAQWATQELHSGKYQLAGLDSAYTYLAEIIYPDNRIVVNYGRREDLVLIGCIERQFGRDLYWSELEAVSAVTGFTLPQRYTFETANDYLNLAPTLSANEEGWVLRYSDGRRFKIKGDAYKVAHYLMTSLSFNKVMEALRDGLFEQIIGNVPDEFLGQIRTWESEIKRTVADIRSQVALAMQDAPTLDGSREARKVYAQWVKQAHPDLAPLLFLDVEGKDLHAAIYKFAYGEHEHAL